MAKTFGEAQFTGTGRRDYNEDRAGSAISLDGGTRVWALCDGLGGHAEGEVAATIALEAALATVRDGHGDPDVGATVRACVTAAHHAVRAAREERKNDMATTIALAVAQGDRIAWAHVGDSRIFRLRDGALQLLTRDHTREAALEAFAAPALAGRSLAARAGAFFGFAAPHSTRSDAAQTAPHHQNIVLAVVGDGQDVCDVSEAQELRDGDVFLLCSDGAWVHLESCEAAQRAAHTAGLDGWLNELQMRIEAAARPDQDNFTALAFVAGAWPAAGNEPRFERRMK